MPRQKRMTKCLTTLLCHVTATVLLLNFVACSKSHPESYKLEDAYLLVIVGNNDAKQELLFAPPVRGIEMVGGDTRVVHETNAPYVIIYRDPNNLGPDAKRNGVKIGTAYLAFDTAKETLFTPMKQFDINLTDDALKTQIQEYMTQQVRSKRAKSK